MFEPHVLRAVGLSILPGVFWLVYLRSLSRTRIAPWLWGIALVAGWASTHLTLFLSGALEVERLYAVPVLPVLVMMVFGVGLLEEFAKAICMILGLTLPGQAKDPLVALQLSGGVALGFATSENVIYILNHGESVIIWRALFSTLGHVLFSAVWGFALGSRIFVTKDGTAQRALSWGSFLKGLVLAGVAHGLFNWFLSTGRAPMAVLLLCILWFGFRQAALEAFLRQEYERELPYETAECHDCGVLTRANGRFCSFCGCSLQESVEEAEPVLSSG